MKSLFPVLVLVAVSGCVDTAESLRFEILGVETEAVDCLMKVVDDNTADEFCKLYLERLKARRKDLKERLDNMRKVMEKKEKEADSLAFDEGGQDDKKEGDDGVISKKNVRYFEYTASLKQRRDYQVKRVTALHELAKAEGETPGFDELKKSEYGDPSK